MKVLQPNSIIVGTRKSWQIFPIKQKFDTTTAFLDNLNCSIWSKLVMFLTMFSTYFHTENTVKNITKLETKLKNLNYLKKAAVVSNFCLIGKIHHQFLVPKMIEWTCKTFMPIQILDLHRVTTKKLKTLNFKMKYAAFSFQTFYPSIRPQCTKPLQSRRRQMVRNCSCLFLIEQALLFF